MLTSERISKALLVSGQTYFLRGAVVFTSDNRAKFRVINGHYKTYTFKSNDK